MENSPVCLSKDDIEIVDHFKNILSKTKKVFVLDFIILVKD